MRGRRVVQVLAAQRHDAPCSSGDDAAVQWRFPNSADDQRKRWPPTCPGSSGRPACLRTMAIVHPSRSNAQPIWDDEVPHPLCPSDMKATFEKSISHHRSRRGTVARRQRVFSGRRQATANTSREICVARREGRGTGRSQGRGRCCCAQLTSRRDRCGEAADAGNEYTASREGSRSREARGRGDRGCQNEPWRRSG